MHQLRPLLRFFNTAKATKAQGTFLAYYYKVYYIPETPMSNMGPVCNVSIHPINIYALK